MKKTVNKKKESFSHEVNNEKDFLLSHDSEKDVTKFVYKKFFAIYSWELTKEDIDNLITKLKSI
jgi:hypothetical protein